MTLFLRQVELLHVQVNFSPEDFESAKAFLVSMEANDLVLTLANGESGALPDYIRAQGVQEMNRPELAHLKDQDTFVLNILFDNLRGAILAGAKGIPLPLPQSVRALYRYHSRIESVALAAYDGSEGINAFTGISSGWGKQLTMVAKLETDGSRTLSFTTGDPKPGKTAIPPREQLAKPAAPTDSKKSAPVNSASDRKRETPPD